MIPTYDHIPSFWIFVTKNHQSIGELESILSFYELQRVTDGAVWVLRKTQICSLSPPTDAVLTQSKGASAAVSS